MNKLYFKNFNILWFFKISIFKFNVKFNSISLTDKYAFRLFKLNLDQRNHSSLFI